MLADEFFGTVFVPVVQDGAVVAGENDDRILFKAKPFQRLEHFAHAPVELRDGVAPEAHRAGAAETFRRESGDVDVVRREIEEEGPVFVLLDELHGVAGEGIGDVLVLPEGLAAALHIADAPDAVHDGHIVPVAGAQVVEQFRVVASGGLALEIGLVADLDGMVGIVADHASVLDVHAGHPVRRRRHNVVIIKSDVRQVLVQFPVPVLFRGLGTQSQVPFADGARPVTLRLEHIGHREAVRADDHPGVAGRNIGPGLAPGILARQEGVAGRRAG